MAPISLVFFTLWILFHTLLHIPVKYFRIYGEGDVQDVFISFLSKILPSIRWLCCSTVVVLVTPLKLLWLTYDISYRDHSVYAPNQWEMALQCNAVSHWLGAYTEWSHSVYAPSQWETALQCNTVSHWLGPYTEWSLHLPCSGLFLVTAFCLTAPSHNYLNQWLILSIRPQENSCKISMKIVFNSNIPI